MPDFGLSLPDYPWNALAPYRERAAAHPDGTVDLSIGTPVDPTPEIVRRALADGADAPGYPTTQGTVEVRQAIAQWHRRRRGADSVDESSVMPTIGSKELVAWLPYLLGLGEGDVVVRPVVAYPTYDIGATLAGARAVAADDLSALDAETRSQVKLVWINSPGNPTGSVRDAESLSRLVADARALGAVVASDECYAELGWGDWDEARGGRAVPSILDTTVSGGDLTGLLSVYSLSKQSNLAGYRAAFVGGDPGIIANLINSRKHAGMIVPRPVQDAMTVALGDDEHVREQKDRYRRRREALKPAVEDYGMRIEDSEAGLYLWGSMGEDTWTSVGRFADLGIVVGPGVFYGDHGQGRIRISLTATDERIDAAVRRLARG